MAVRPFVELGPRPGPQRAHRRQALVVARTAALPRNPERVELLAQSADADPEFDAAPRACPIGRRSFRLGFPRFRRHSEACGDDSDTN